MGHASLADDQLVSGADISFADATMTVRIGAAEVGGVFSILEEAVPAGSATTLHRHLGIVEAFYVLEGSYMFEVGDDVVEVGPGGVAVVPASTAHRWTAGNAGGRSLLIFAPGGSERYFRDLGEAIRGSGIDQAFRDRMKARYGLEVLDPLP
jgi:mannose-6-phosphate isomerase-like protein (cupin superfamily)